MSQLALLASTSRNVGATARKTAKVKTLSECLQQLAEDEIEIGTQFLSGELPQGKVGIGYAALRNASNVPAMDSSGLTLHAVNAALNKYASIKGSGSAAARNLVLSELFAGATSKSFS